MKVKVVKAVCYSYISYYTAWLKKHYPLVFHKTMLNGNLGDLSEYINMARMDGIKLLLPDVNFSNLKTEIEDEQDKSLRIGFNVINGVGEKAVESIVANRPYKSINDFLARNNSKGTNKRVVESLINAGCMDNLPIEVDTSLISLLNTKDIDLQGNLLYLNRKQLQEWYKSYLENLKPASIPNYEISISTIKMKYIQQYDLVEEKNGCVIIPETFMNTFELTIDETKKTRKKPKGKLKEIMESGKINLDKCNIPFAKDLDEIISQQVTELELYLRDIENDQFSFLPHPLEHLSKILTNFKESSDGSECIEAGIIMSLIPKMSKNDKKYYWMYIRTPLETIRCTLWQSQINKYKKLIKQFGLIAVRGNKGYGGISVNDIKIVHTK